MPPHSPSAFAVLFRALDDAERTRFVAALWRARGWETSIADDTVVARAGERTRRIGVIRPGRLRTASLSGLDVVVVTHDRPRVREAAAESDVEYVTPAALRDLLCYGVDREKAATVFSTHFGRSLEVPGSGGEETAVDGADSLPALPTRTGTLSAGAVLVVACLVLAAVFLANPSLLAFGGPPAPTGAVAGTFTPDASGALGGDDGSTPEPSAYPAGLDADGVTNTTRLSDVHLQKTLNRRYAFSFGFGGPADAPGFDDWVAIDWKLVVEHEHAFRVDGAFNGTDGRWRVVGVYANGVTDYRIYRTQNSTRTTESPVDASSADTYAYFGKRLVATYLNASESSVECITETEDGCDRYLVVATGDATGVASDLPDGDASIARYQAIALVRADGFVTDLSVHYYLVRDGASERVSLSFSYDEYGTARITPPAWLSDVRTDDARHSSATPENATEPSPTESAPVVANAP